MKRVTVATIAVLMLACVLPMARAQEAASNEQSPEVVRQDDQRSQEIDALKAQLEQLISQQRQLQERLRALSEEPGRRVVKDKTKHPEMPMMVQPRQEKVTHQHDVTVVPWQDREPTEEELRTLKDARKQAEQARQEQQRTMDEVKKAQKEIEKARQQAGRAAAEGEKAKAHAEHQKEWATHQQWTDQMGQWAHREQMQRWSADLEKWENSEAMSRWKQDVERWAQELERRHEERRDNASDTSADKPPAAEVPPMPAMPPMPAIPAMPHVENVPGMPATPVPVPQPMPHVKIVPPHVTVPPVAAPAKPAVPAASARAKDPRQIVPCGEYLVESLPAGTVVKVENGIGSIKIEGAKGRDCTVKATAEIRSANREEAERIARDIKIQILPAGGQVRINVQLPEGTNQEKGTGVSVNLVIVVPHEAGIQVVQKVGDLGVSSLLGDVKASVDVGAIQAMDLQGSAVLQTNVGNISFTTSKDLSAVLRAQAKVGGISSNLPLEITRASVMQAGDVQNALGSQAQGTLGHGEHKIDLSANVGSIQIRSAPAPVKHEVF